MAAKLKVLILPVRPVWYCRQQSGGLRGTQTWVRLSIRQQQWRSHLRGLVPALHLGDLDLPLPARRGVRAQEVEVDRGRVRRGGAKIDVN